MKITFRSIAIPCAVAVVIMLGAIVGMAIVNNGRSDRTSQTDPLPTAVRTDENGTRTAVPESEWPAAWKQHLDEAFPEYECVVDNVTPPEDQDDGSGLWTANVTATAGELKGTTFAAKYDPAKKEWYTTLAMDAAIDEVIASANTALEEAGLADAVNVYFAPRKGSSWFIDDAEGVKTLSLEEAKKRCQVTLIVEEAEHEAEVGKQATTALKDAGFRYVTVGKRTSPADQQ